MSDAKTTRVVSKSSSKKKDGSKLPSIFGITTEQWDKMSYHEQNKLLIGDQAIDRVKRPCIRVRRSGPVGPELDVSVRYSNVPKILFYDLKGSQKAMSGTKALDRVYKWFPMPPGGSTKTYSGESAKYRPRKPAFLVTDFVTDYGIQAWTKFAMLNGIEYSGDFDYRIPRKKPEHIPPKEDRVAYFKSQKAYGFIPHAKRSREAKQRRSLKRTVNEYIKKCTPMSLPIVAHKTPSARKVRNGWFSHPFDCTFSEYKRKVQKTELVVDHQRSITTRAPKLVLTALGRIYHNIVMEPKPDFHWVPSEAPLKRAPLISDKYPIKHYILPNGESKRLEMQDRPATYRSKLSIMEQQQNAKRWRESGYSDQVMNEIISSYFH